MTADRRPRRRRRWGPMVRWTFWLLVFAAIGAIAWNDRDEVTKAVAVMANARLPWMLAGVVAIGGVYLCRAGVYATPLHLLGYSFTRGFLWSTALIATSTHQLLPAGGATGYAFLTWALSRHGVGAGRASLIALIDTLSYAIAVAVLVVGSLLYLVVAGHLAVGNLAATFAPGLLIVGVAAYVYHLQRERRRLTRVVLGVARWVAARVGADRPDRRVITFLQQYFEAKAVIARRRRAFATMVGLQFVAVGCDAAAVYAACLAVGVVPEPWIVLMSFVLAMAGLAVVAVPGGGGSFELIMTTFLSAHGFAPAQAIAVAVLYRAVAFWLPVAVSLVLLYRLGRWRTRAVRRIGKSAA